MLRKGLEGAAAAGANNPAVAMNAELLGNVYLSLGRPDLAEPLMRQALRVIEGQPKPEKWRVAYGLRNVANCQAAAGNADEAEVAYKQSLRLLESETRPPQVGESLTALARLYLATGRAKEADALSRQGMAKFVEAKSTGIRFARAQLVRGAALAALGRPAEAAEMYKAGLAAFAADASQAESPELVPALTTYAKLLRADKKTAEAAKLEARAASIAAKRDVGRDALPK